MRAFCAALALSACVAAQTPQTSTTPVREILDELRAKHAQPAMAAAVVKGEEIVAADAGGVRVIDEPAPVELGDRFHIGSVTKSFTAMLAAMLVEEGKLAWSTTIGEALPELKGKIRDDYLSVRLDQLLSHTGGVPPYTNFGQARLDELLAIPGTPSEQRLRFITEVLNEAPAAKPGEKEVYSNAGYAAAAVLIERAAGKPWEELIRERIFQSLKMTSADFGWPATSDNPHQPRGHSPALIGGILRPQPLDDVYRLPPCLAPAGAVNCSIEDLARYARDHLMGLQGRGKLLKRESYEKLHDTWNGQPSGFTLGWGRRVDEDLGVIHYGAGSGGTFFVRIWLAPKVELAIVVASNSGTGADATKESIERLARAHR